MTLKELREKRAEQVRRLAEIHAGFGGIKNAMKNGAYHSIKYSAVFNRKAELTKELHACTAEIARLNAEIQNVGDKVFAKAHFVTISHLVADCGCDDDMATRIYAWFNSKRCSIVARQAE